MAIAPAATEAGPAQAEAQAEAQGPAERRQPPGAERLPSRPRGGVSRTELRKGEGVCGVRTQHSQGVT